jgi:hypothetical protein
MTTKLTYRPTVRYPDIFKEYVDEVYNATSLDRNQIIRLALYVLGHSKEGIIMLESFSKQDVPLPSPSWELLNDMELWLGSTKIGSGGEVIMKIKKRIGEPTSKHKKRAGEPTSKNKPRRGDQDETVKKFEFKQKGGIKITLS